MESLYGVLDLLVLRTLLFGPRHGYALASAIRNTSGDSLKVEFGSLSPALTRLELKGWITAQWELSEQGRRTRVYSLTTAGREQLRQETSQWTEFAKGVARVLNPVPGEAEG